MQEESQENCGICHESFTSNNLLRTVCNHSFCSECLFKSRNENVNDCPMCRNPDALIRLYYNTFRMVNFLAESTVQTLLTNRLFYVPYDHSKTNFVSIKINILYNGQGAAKPDVVII